MTAETFKLSGGKLANSASSYAAADDFVTQLALDGIVATNSSGVVTITLTSLDTAHTNSTYAFEKLVRQAQAAGAQLKYVVAS